MNLSTIKRSLLTFTCSICLFAALPLLPAQPASPQLGINLGGGMRDFFVDVALTARAWEGPGGGTLAPTDLDENGWPTRDFRTVLMDGRPVPEWAGSIDDPQRYRVDLSGRYQGSFKGQANIIKIAGDWSIQHQTYDEASNTTTFELIVGPPGPDHGLVIMVFSNTRRSPSHANGSGITDLSIRRPGYEDRPRQLFTDAFLNTLTEIPFTTLRSQTFTGTTSWKIPYPTEVDWADRKPATYALQGSDLGNKREHAAWEYFIQLCNQVNMDIWVNVPISASEDYVRQLAQLLKDSVKPSLNIYVENDNEVWNFGEAFVGSYDYNHAEAEDLGLTPEQNIARRAVELSQIFGDVFGQDAINQRVRVILASHAPMVKWWVRPMMNYIQAQFGPPRDYIYAVSRQTYFRSSTEPNASIEQLFQGAMDDINDQLAVDAVNEANRSDWVAFANEWQLPGGVTSYEGGPHFPAGGSTSNLSNQIQIHRQEEMKTLMQYNLREAWWELGGGLVMHFTLYGSYNRYGCWGLTDDLSNPDRNQKFEALRELMDEATSIDPKEKGVSFSLFPNPTSGEVVLLGGNGKPVEAALLNLKGQLLQSWQPVVPGQGLSLPAGLPRGLYVLRVRHEAGSYHLKLQVD